MPKAHAQRLADARAWFGMLCCMSLLPLAEALAEAPLAEAPSVEDRAPRRVDWTMVDTIVAAIETPRIPDRTYRVKDFGAAGDGSADARPALLAAIAKAKAEGGGRVSLSPGVWRSDGP